MNQYISSKGFVFDPTPVTEIYETQKGFIHPGALRTLQDFERVKVLLAAKDPTIVAAYNRLTINEYAQSGVVTYPVETIMRGGSSGQNYMNASRGAGMAYQNALRWKISGDKSHADRAVIVLNAWAAACKYVEGDTNQSLASGLNGYQYANAEELMRDYEGWMRGDFKKFKRWMIDVWYPRCIDFQRRCHDTWLNAANGYSARSEHYWSNWALCNVLGLMSIGVLCDDVSFTIFQNTGDEYHPLLFGG